MKKLILFFCLLHVFLIKKPECVGQEFKSDNILKKIPLQEEKTLFPILVKGLPSEINNDYGIESVLVDINHQNMGQVDIYLLAPDGTTIELNTDNGENKKNFNHVIFTMKADTLITDTTILTYTGNYRAEGDIGAFNNFQNPNGIWNLYIYDDTPDSLNGILNSFSVKFSKNPAQAFISSNLPIVIINTNEQYIDDEPKIMADMEIISLGSDQRNSIYDSIKNYKGKIGIEIRGSSSQQFPKKSYGFETWDLQKNQIDVPLLDFPADHNWTLTASYSDKSLLRNFLGYQIFQKMGHYSVRSRFVELILNKSYQGLYLLTEKIAKADHKINISKLTTSDNTNNNISGGYIFKIDKKKNYPFEGWESKIASNNHDDKVLFQYYYPKAETITEAQKNYIKAYVDSFEYALNNNAIMDNENNYRKFIDENSFIDHFIFNEICKNPDAYRLSTYFYKDKNEKIHNGPVWDLDIAFHNSNFGGEDQINGWQYEYGWEWSPTLDTIYPTPFWWRKFMQDTLFVDKLYCRYQNLRASSLSNKNLIQLIDSTSAVLEESQKRNFYYWPIMGKYVWPNPIPLATDYKSEILNLKNWLEKRLMWIDQNIPGKCLETSIVRNQLNEEEIEIFPNPVNNILNFKFINKQKQDFKINLIDLQGKILFEKTIEDLNRSIHSDEINLTDYHSGFYFLKITTSQGSISKKIVKT